VQSSGLLLIQTPAWQVALEEQFRLQGEFVGASESVGHVAEVPGQYSGTSHWDAAGLHTKFALALIKLQEASQQPTPGGSHCSVPVVLLSPQIETGIVACHVKVHPIESTTARQVKFKLCGKR
jgi:hypothetical protein